MHVHPGPHTPGMHRFKDRGARREAEEEEEPLHNERDSLQENSREEGRRVARALSVRLSAPVSLGLFSVCPFLRLSA